MLYQGLDQVLPLAGDDVDHPRRHVRGIQYLVEIGRAQRVLLAGDHHHRVAACDRRGHQGDECQQRRLVRAGDAQHAHRLVDRHCDAAQGGFLYTAPVLIRPGRISKQALDGRLHLGPRRFQCHTGHRCDPPGEFVRPRAQVFADEVKDLAAVVRVAHGPARFGRVCRVGRLHRIADVLAVPVSYLSHQLPLGSQHRAGVVPIRAHLFAADVHLGRTVDVHPVFPIRMMPVG